MLLMSAALSLRMDCAAYRAPLAAVKGPPTAAPFTAAEIALPVLMVPWMVWTVLTAWDRLFFSWLFSFGHLHISISQGLTVVI